MGDKNSYYINIPAKVRYDKKLNPNAKLLYGEINALCNEKGYCWASNSHFSNLYEVSKTSVSTWIKNLKVNKHIKIKFIYKKESKQVLERRITLIKDPMKEKLKIPIQEKFKDNNTDINNTSNTKKDYYSSREFRIPTLSEIQEYISIENLNVDPNRFFLHYKSNSWTEKGEPIKDWIKLLKAWSKNNNKEKDYVRQSEKIDWEKRNDVGASNVQSLSEIIRRQRKN